MAIQTLSLKIEGAAPLIMHNGELANRNYWAAKAIKSLTSMTKKTDSDHDEIARLEWFGSLYLKDKKVSIPRFLQEATLIDGAKKIRLKKPAQAGLFATDDTFLEFDKKDLPIEELWKLEEHQLYKTAKINGKSKVMRMRPIFREWSFTMHLKYLDELLNEKQIIQMAEIAGMQCGIGDWRPQNGRFLVKKL